MPMAAKSCTQLHPNLGTSIHTSPHHDRLATRLSVGPSQVEFLFYFVTLSVKTRHTFESDFRDPLQMIWWDPVCSTFVEHDDIG
jgi:hypothetical protein